MKGFLATIATSSLETCRIDDDICHLYPLIDKRTPSADSHARGIGCLTALVLLLECQRFSTQQIC